MNNYLHAVHFLFSLSPCELNFGSVTTDGKIWTVTTARTNAVWKSFTACHNSTTNLEYRKTFANYYLRYSKFLTVYLSWWYLRRSHICENLSLTNLYGSLRRYFYYAEADLEMWMSDRVAV